MRVVVDTSELKRLEREMPGLSERVVQKIAQDAQAQMVDGFSPSSPAPAGGPPGVDTGALKNSIVARPDGNGWLLADGVEYGVYLEFGTARMAARPFFLRGIERAVNDLPNDLARMVYIDGRVDV